MNQETGLIPDVSFLPGRYIRMVSYLCGAIILALGVFFKHLEWSVIWLVIGIVLYPLASNLLLDRFFEFSTPTTRIILVVTDSLICGLLIASLDFDLIIALSFSIIVSCAVMMSNGLQHWLVSIVAIVLGSMLSALLLQGEHFKTLDGDIQWYAVASVLVVGLYISILNLFAYRQASVLHNTHRELTHQKEKSAALSRKLAKYLPPQVWGSMFAGRKERRLETQRKKLTVFFSDICRFSEISEELQPEALTDLLNSYFTEMSRIAAKYGGTIDKFVGDAILVFFGDPNSHGDNKDALACVSMAIEMRKKMKILCRQWARLGINQKLEIRMGINTGYCTIGNFGADTRMDYTIIGKEVNLASRLESQSQPNGILISEQTYNLVRDMVLCRDIGEISVKGFNKPVPIYEVVDFRKELGAEQSFIEHEVHGFSLYLDIDKINNYDKDRVIQALQDATKQVRDKLIV